ncbi:hypothetical protein RF11_00012 [Thelohanellus kitauei]|uniref:Uncharacterized protein n=1 Tax=Thelohanellus kitauei TaxID=669202 RepID=A0A0C2JX36_THEKT|nr:hypothetical protein RF11_00012 [Thelohanellus kitauei]
MLLVNFYLTSPIVFLRMRLTDEVKTTFHRLFERDNSVSSILNILVLFNNVGIHVLNSLTDDITEMHFKDAINNVLDSHRNRYLSDLMEIEVLILLMALKYMKDKYENTFQKSVILKNCKYFCSSDAHKQVSMFSLNNAFESLVYNKVISPESRSETPMLDTPYVLMYSEFEIRHSVHSRTDLPNYIKLFQSIAM